MEKGMDGCPTGGVEGVGVLLLLLLLLLPLLQRQMVVGKMLLLELR